MTSQKVAAFKNIQSSEKYRTAFTLLELAQLFLLLIPLLLYVLCKFITHVWSSILFPSESVDPNVGSYELLMDRESTVDNQMDYPL